MDIKSDKLACAIPSSPYLKFSYLFIGLMALRDCGLHTELVKIIHCFMKVLLTSVKGLNSQNTNKHFLVSTLSYLI